MSLAHVHPEYRLWRYVWKLLRLRWQIFFSGFRHARLRRKIGYVVFILFVLGVLVGAFVGSWFILRFLRSPQLAQFIDPAQFLSSVPVLVVSAAFLGILLTSFGVLLQALYLAGDMDFLLSSPAPIRAVFVAKLLQAILPNLGLICFFGLPILFGLGAASGYNILYYPLVLIVLAALALAAAGLSSLLVMGVVRIFPARRVAEVLGFVGAIVSIVCSQSGQLTSHADFTQAQASQAFSTLARLNAPWSPLSWAGRGLVDIGEGRWVTGAGFLILTVGLAGIIFAIALNTAERLYYTGWASVQVGTRKKATRKAAQETSRQAAQGATWIEHLVPPAVRGLIIKDFLVIRRDLRNMSQLVSPLIFGVIYAVMLVRGGGQPPSGEGEAPEWVMQAMKNALLYGQVGISLFVSWSLLSRLAMMGFSQEGKHYWLLKVAPLSSGKLLLSKFMVAYLPALAMGWGFLLAISLVQVVSLGSGSLAAMLFGLPVVALCIAGATGVNLAFGVAGVNLEWEDPRQMMRGPMGCIGMLVSFAYLGVTLILFFGPPIALSMFGGSELIGQFVGLLLGGVLCLICAIAPPLFVRDRVARIGEA